MGGGSGKRGNVAIEASVTNNEITDVQVDFQEKSTYSSNRPNAINI